MGFILGKIGSDGVKTVGITVGDGITEVRKILGMVDANLEDLKKVCKRFIKV
jgi:hypothetical protein